MMLEDRYLVWRLKQGSRRALCRIYDRYETDLLTLARSLLGRTGEAEDVLQDVFVRFIESIDSFELTGSLRGYLVACVANRARDYLRKDRRRMGEPAGSVPGRAWEEDALRRHYEREQREPLQEVIADEQRQRLTAALVELPYEQREAVLLHLQAGLKFHEIARVQGVAAKTAWSRYRYGLDRLRSMLNGQV